MSLMDVARGAYVRSPAILRRSLAPLVALVPTELKFGSVYRRWRVDIARSASEPSFASARHRDSLANLLQKAQQSPFHARRIRDAFGASFDPEALDIEDIRRLPILRKSDLAAAGDSVLAVPRSQVDDGDTSGSNGERPFAFFLDKDRSAREIAFVNHVWSRTGYSEADARVVLRGFGTKGLDGKLTEWEPALRELRLAVFPLTIEDAAAYLDLIDRHEVRYLYGYPSAIDVFCRHLLRLGRTPRLPFKGILPISEPMYPHQRATIAETFGPVPVANFYGLSEKALFASELPGDDGTYEFEPLYGLAELVDDNGNLITEPGVEGRLIGTGFISTGMPFIRYDTEDRATLVRLPTAQNGYRMRVRNIMPRRKPNYLVDGEGNRVVTIDFTPDSPRFFTGISEYQFFQEVPGEVSIRYIPSPGGSPEEAERVRADLQHRTHDRIRFTLERVESLCTGRSGKRAFIDQRLDLTKY
jgi:phenylacetate-CoA ligase